MHQFYLLFIIFLLTSCEDSLLFNKGSVLSAQGDKETSLTNYHLSGICVDGAFIRITGAIKEKKETSCVNSKYSVQVELELGDGLKEIEISQYKKDDLSLLERKIREVILDQTPAGLSIDLLDIINLSNKSSYRIEGNCTENGQSIELNAGSLGPFSNIICANDRWATQIDLNSLSDGLISFNATHSDHLGNTSPVFNASIQKDTLAPNLSFNSPVNIDISNVINYAVSGNCSEDGEELQFKIGGMEPAVQPICGGSSWSIASMDLSSLSNGAISLEISQTDLAGNKSTINSSITKSVFLAAPSGLSLISPLFASNSDNTPSVRVTGVASGDIIKVFTDSNCSTQIASQTSSGVSIDIETQVLNEGSYVLYANRTQSGFSSNCSTASLNYEVTKAFISTWTTTIANEEIRLPVVPGETYNFTVD